MEDQISSTESTFIARKNAIKMMTKRGYVLRMTDDMTKYDAFLSRFGNEPDYESLSVIGKRLSNKNDGCLLIFNDSPSLGAPAIREIIEQLEKENISSAIIVVKNRIPSTAKHACKKFEPIFHLDLFKESSLLVDITEHFLVPPHIALSEQETKDLLERLSIPADKLPKISVDDPICHYYGFKQGQVIKIIRNSLVGGRSVAFRVVM